MKSERIDLSVDLTVCMAITDYAAQVGISEEESRNRLLGSKAAALFFDENNNLWTEGPDALIELYKEIG